MSTTRPLQDFANLKSLTDYFDSNEKCSQYLAYQRWGTKPICPCCNQGSVYMLNGKHKRYKCAFCRTHFSVKAGTIFQGSKLSLQIWFQAIFLVCNTNKRVSSTHLQRTLGVSQKTAWLMIQKIKGALIRTSIQEDKPGIMGEHNSHETFN